MAPADAADVDVLAPCALGASLNVQSIPTLKAKLIAGAANNQLATAAELDLAVQAALRAQPAWAATNPQRRARVLFEFKRLVERDMEELAALLSS